MEEQYRVEVCKELERKFHSARLHRPMRVECYDAGDELFYDITTVSEADGAATGRVHLVVEKFVGGGFAGQVYRVKVVDISRELQAGLAVNGIYAMKILIPPSGFSLLFRNFLYFIGFQASFQLQTNPTASRAGALWQKFIRRGAQIQFSDENVVNNIHATFVDTTLGSCGELSDWVEGRTWRLEVDDRMDLLKNWRKGKKNDVQPPGLPEYRCKKQFMDEFVRLLHDMGAHEFARQYEWSTCKSQPNCLKRVDADSDPEAGLVAVDFRAGLALLPFLPMSPGDFKLIAQGVRRGSLVQFDRGDLNRLEAFMQAHNNEFAGMQTMFAELREAEQVYRDSIPDITHNHVRLLYSRSLWSTILSSAVTGWKVRNIIDKKHEAILRSSTTLTVLFCLMGLIPFAGRIVCKLWGHADWRKHYGGLLTSRTYWGRSVQGKVAERVISWYRSGRIRAENALKITESFSSFLRHLPASFLPVGLHRLLTDWHYAKQRLAYYIVRPVRLYFDSQLREQWLRDMVADGQKKHIITDEDAAEILSQIKEPFIQKYLKSLAVHVCTLPVTQIVSVVIAVIYVLTHPEMPRSQSWSIGVGIIALFQVIPVSPGSLVRGLYVVYLVVRERNFRDYNIAVFLGFFKYIGYLAFPIQMTYRYPTLARFMAGHWATDAVHIVPVFGEHGALLEHGVFCFFYNWPLTIRKGLQKRAEKRAALQPRYWHVSLCALAGAAVCGLADYVYLGSMGVLPTLKDLWWLAVIVPLLGGAAITAGCRGAAFSKRVIAAALGGLLTALGYTLLSTVIGSGSPVTFADMLTEGVWRMFVFTIFTTIGAILFELRLTDNDFV